MTREEVTHACARQGDRGGGDTHGPRSNAGGGAGSVRISENMPQALGQAALQLAPARIPALCLSPCTHAQMYLHVAVSPCHPAEPAVEAMPVRPRAPAKSRCRLTRTCAVRKQRQGPNWVAMLQPGRCVWAAVRSDVFGMHVRRVRRVGCCTSCICGGAVDTHVLVHLYACTSDYTAVSTRTLTAVATLRARARDAARGDDGGLLRR